jgi:hypothetical protein
MSLRPHQFRIFREILDSLERRLKSLEEIIRRSGEVISGISDEKKAEQEIQREISKQISLLSRPKEERETNSANQARRHSENHWAQLWIMRGTWFTGFCTLFAFGAAVYYAGQARQQSITMNKTYCEVQKQTALLQQQLENTNAASVTVQAPFGLYNFGQVDFVITNIGHYVATDINLNAVVTLKAFPSNETIRVFSAFPKRISRLEPEIPNVDASLQRNHFREWNVVYSLSNSEKMLLEAGRAAVTASLSYSFSNGFREIDNIDAGCFGYFKRPPLWEVKTPTGQVQGSGHQEGTYPCELLKKNMVDASEWEAKNRRATH